MGTIGRNIQQAHDRIAAACLAHGRCLQEVTLLCVTKTFASNAVREAYAAGERQFGENYVQEGVDKIAELADLRPHVQWHFIGPLQSNKTRAVAENFDWVHSVDRLKVAQRLSEQRPVGMAPLQVCLQVNISGEPSKSGVSPEELPALATAVAALPRLRLRGLMAIPEPATRFEDQRLPHRALALLLKQLQHGGVAGSRPLAGTGLSKPDERVLDTLSMGMSADLEAAIAEGATCVRVGSAIFGSRAQN